MAGLVDGGSLGSLQVITPTTASIQNLCTNPSFELNTTGWTPTNATLTRTVGGVRGAYMGRLLASATNGKAGFTCGSVTSGTSNVASAYVRADSALVQIKITIGASSATQFHPGDGAYHRIEVPVTAPSTTTPVVEIIDTRTSAWTNVDIDAVMVETGVSVASTYIDGDEVGCAWDGALHASTSTRDARDGRGGVITSFDSLGLYVEGLDGIGTPPVDVQIQQQAMTDGAIYQGSPIRERIITLSTYLAGAGLAALHTARATVLAALNPDKRINRGPVVLRYATPTVTKRISAYYEGGLEFKGSGPMANERTAFRFLATDPYFYSEMDSQASLTVNSTLTYNTIAQRSKTGVWSNLAGGVTGGTPQILAIVEHPTDGRLLVGGTFTNTGDSSSATNFAVWNGTAWSRLGAISPNGAVNAIIVAPNGDIIIGGAFTAVGAVANTNRIARWDGTNWNALGTGMNGDVRALAYDLFGNLIVTGAFTTAGGVAAVNAAKWDGTTWASAATGTPGVVTAMASGYPIWGVSSTGLWSWDGTTWFQWAPTAGLTAVEIHKGVLYAVGDFTGFSIATTARGIVRYRGFANYEPLAEGLGVSGTQVPNALSSGADGNLYASGHFFEAGNFGGTTTSTQVQSFAVWNGSTWYPLDIIAPASADAQPESFALLAHKSGALTISSRNAGTATIPGITTVTNSGTATAYPVVKISTAPGLGQFVFSLENLTTRQRIQFNAYILNGENLYLDLRPGQRRVYSDRRDLTSILVPGSKFAEWGLAPGDNRIALFALGASTTAQMWWRPTYLSAD